MAFQETELHKLHLRILALEGRKKFAPEHLQPDSSVLANSDVKFPAEEQAEAIEEANDGVQG